MTQQTFAGKIEAYKATVQQLPEVDELAVQQAAKRLLNFHFTPTLILPIEDFITFSKADMLAEIERIVNLTDDEIKEQRQLMHQDTQEVKLEDIGLLVYNFTLLTRLRRDEPEAWDEIEEMYGED